jgi:hypothetical protein
MLEKAQKKALKDFLFGHVSYIMAVLEIYKLCALTCLEGLKN